MTQVDLFELTYGKPLMLGMLVRVVSDKSWASEWPDTYQVLGLKLDPKTGEVDIALDDSCSSSDGFTIYDVQPV